MAREICALPRDAMLRTRALARQDLLGTVRKSGACHAEEREFAATGAELFFVRRRRSACAPCSRSVDQACDRSTLIAPVPPSTRRAEVNASTGPVLRRIMLTAVLITGPFGPEPLPLPWMTRTQRRRSCERFGQELAQRRLGFLGSQAVQVADGFDADTRRA
jgi:hypothetical protein